VSSVGRRRAGLIALFVILLAVGALALAAMAGGSDDTEPPPATADGEALDDLPDELVADNTESLEDQGAEQRLAEDEAREALAALATREPDDLRALGDPDAPVVMVQWADFLCPFCGVFARDIESELVARYVDAGMMRIEWWDLPLQGEQAILAALGGQAAAQQGAFWAYHETLFAEDLRSDENRVDRDFLLAIAGELGMDTDAFAADLDDPALEQLAQTEAATGRSIGISGTPAFIVGGYPLLGAQPLETFAQVIEAAAQDAGVELP